VPSEFKEVDGDESAPGPATKKERKNPWASYTEEQKKERLAKLAAGREAKKVRKMSEDSLNVPSVAAAPSAPDYESWGNQKLRDELADRDGVPPTPDGAEPSGPRRHTPKFKDHAALVAELRRRDAAPSAAATAPAVAVAAPESDAASETSSKKERKNVWDSYTPEQKAERLAKAQATREAKKAKASAAAADGSA
jgi:predicted Fe-S protein YdhL (DUF1289 family)